jgi:ankyrin repeat protein
VAIRPLEVKELAEVLAIDFDDTEGIPKLKLDWRWEDEEQALLTSCSSLITTIEARHSRLVQFSHFSVKEYLTSARLATSNGDVSRYHIDLEPAHIILAQACMGILLRPDDHVEENGVGKKYPLAGYAAEYWVTHAQFGRVPTFLRKAMEYLFDPDEPYFAAWLQLHDIDTSSEDPFHTFSVSRTSGAIPLYYATLCGFQDLVEHLVAKYPQHVNTSGGEYGTPLVAALAGRHFQIARHLLHNGAQVDVRDEFGFTPLSSASWYGDLETVQLLLDYKADANTRSFINNTPMHRLPLGFQFLGVHHHSPQMLVDIARLLLEHGAEVNAQTTSGRTPLHDAAMFGQVEVARVFLERGANVGAEDEDGETPLHICGHGPGKMPFVTNYEKPEVVRMLLKRGADVGAKDNKGSTPLHAAAKSGMVEIVRVLLEHGANVGAEDNEGKTPFQIASAKGNGEITKLLSEHGAKGVL